MSFSGSINLARPYQPGKLRPTNSPSTYYHDGAPDYYYEEPVPGFDDDYEYGEGKKDCWLHEGMRTTWYRLETAEKVCRK